MTIARLVRGATAPDEASAERDPVGRYREFVAALRDMLAQSDGVRFIGPKPNAARTQVGEAFPGATLRGVTVYQVLRDCASPRLQEAVEMGVIGGRHAYELAHLDHEGQDAVLALGVRAAKMTAREIAHIRRGLR